MNNVLGDSPTLRFPFQEPVLMMDPLTLTPEMLSENGLLQIDSANASTTQEEEYRENLTRSTRAAKRFSTDELSAYDLQPPPPAESDPRCETLVARLYSADHLKLIIKEPAYFQRFLDFLKKHRPQSVALLQRCVESQKALAAIRYANALAEQLSTVSRKVSCSIRNEAALIDPDFESLSRKSMEELVTQDLPAYITHRMVTLVTECLVKEITGSNTPLMQELVQGLAEVYCLSDPRQPDCPVVFASEEFYNTTQYGYQYVIGKNCRFLQGPKTQKPAVERLSNAIRNGREISEILLNYRRNGSPFLNLLMMAPLHDSRGQVCYYLGAQIDISHLIEGGRGLESFKHLLELDGGIAEKTKHQSPRPDAKTSLSCLRELSGLLSDEEIEVIKHRNRDVQIRESVSSNTSHSRRFVGMNQPNESAWPLGPNGRLPGVYQAYLLVRPYPSLRIIFTSPALRIPGLSQSKLMDRIGGPKHVRDSVLDALAQGISVTAKISWLNKTASTYDQPPSDALRDLLSEDDYATQSEEGKPRWIHCTPLLGSDGRPGVIMIVMVDKEEITGTLSSQRTPSRASSSRKQAGTKEDRPMLSEGFRTPPPSVTAGAAKLSVSKLYANHMFREGSMPDERDYNRMERTNSGIGSLQSTPSVKTFIPPSRRGTPVLQPKSSLDFNEIGGRSNEYSRGVKEDVDEWRSTKQQVRRGLSILDLKYNRKVHS